MAQQVYNIEIIKELAEKVPSRFKKLGYNNINLRTGDNYFSWLVHAPFDGIIVTVAAPCIPQPLIEQLKAGARLVIPVGFPYNYQELMVVEKKTSGKS